MAEKWMCLGKFGNGATGWASASPVDSREDAEAWVAEHARKYGEARAVRINDVESLPYIESTSKVTTTEHGFGEGAR